MKFFCQCANNESECGGGVDFFKPDFCRVFFLALIDCRVCNCEARK